ncbi:MAG: hypothetical protein ACYCSB_01470 [bacterium]
MKTINKSHDLYLSQVLEEYKKSLRLSKKYPDDKILKIQVSCDKYTIKSLILKEYIKKWQES